MIAATSTAERVTINTEARINRRIERHTEESVAACAELGRAAVDARLAELDEEWDVERCLETMAPAFTLFGLGMSIVRRRSRWLGIPLLVQSFFLQHALQGWCPPLVLLRRLGFRTAGEIDRERNALKALRGDYRSVPKSRSKNGRTAKKALQAARK